MNIFRRNFKRYAVAAAACAVIFGTSATLAQEGKQVGSVIDIDGPVLMTNRLKEGKWYQGYPRMKTYLKERLMADPKTTATIEFLVGGRAVISPGTEVEILTPKDITVLKIKKGTIWAKFDKQDKQFQIQTAGGVMGIEGTEFFVEADENGQTKLVVVEGSVNVNGKESVGPGREADFKGQALDVAEYAAYNTPESALRDAAFGRLDPETRNVLMPVVDRALWYVPGRFSMNRYFYSNELYWARRGIDAIRDPKNAAANEIARQTGLPIAGMFQSKPPEPIRNAGISGPPQSPEFGWDKVKKADSYTVVVANDSEGKDVVWYTTTKNNKIAYPPYGPALVAGQTYHLFVTPMKGKEAHHHEGQSLGIQTTFNGSGHQPVFAPVSGVTANTGSGLPSVSWAGLTDAKAYRVTFKNSAGDIVWTADTVAPKYDYPAEARALDPGDYTVTVEAFDPAGLKMAESKTPGTFASAGWDALGLSGPPRPAE